MTLRIKSQPRWWRPFWLAHSLALATVVALPVLVSSPAEAATCKALRAQLASAGQRSTPSDVRRAIRSQKRQISTMKRRISGLKCSASRSLIGGGKAQCRASKRLLSRMQANLNSLNQRRGKAGPSRSRIRRQMRRQNCRTSDRRSASVSKRIFEKSKKRRRSRKSDGQSATSNVRLRNYKTVRTVCVRPSDGFFFPISFSTTTGKLERDTERCAAMCPGVRTELFYHRTSGETAADMVSVVDGRPYSDTPTAFAFKKAFDSRNRCERPIATATARASVRQAAVNPLDDVQAYEDRTFTQVAMNARPAWRPDPFADPETSALRSSLESLLDVAAGQAVAEEPTQSAKRRVRVIGEEFFPVQ